MMCLFGGEGGIDSYHHFQHFFSFIVTTSFYGRGKHDSYNKLISEKSGHGVWELLFLRWDIRGADLCQLS